MKTTKLIEKIQDLLKKGPEEAKRTKLRKTIRALKQKQKDLEARLDDADGKHERQRLKQKIEVLRAQRLKGIKLYKELKKRGD